MLGNIQINIPIDLGIIQSKNQSSLKNKEDGTKNVDSNNSFFVLREDILNREFNIKQ